MKKCIRIKMYKIINYLYKLSLIIPCSPATSLKLCCQRDWFKLTQISSLYSTLFPYDTRTATLFNHTVAWYTYSCSSNRGTDSHACIAHWHGRPAIGDCASTTAIARHELWQLTLKGQRQTNTTAVEM